MKICVTILLSVILTATTNFGQTTILWNESVSGDLSQYYSIPTSLGNLQLVTNIIIGATEIEPTGNSWFVHPEIFTIEVPNNSVVTALYIQIDSPNVWAWIGDPTFSSGLGFTDNASTGELLSQWAIDSIDSGVYGMYLANMNALPYTSIANYQLDFVVETVPEPGMLGMLLLGAGIFTLRHCRKSHFLS